MKPFDPDEEVANQSEEKQEDEGSETMEEGAEPMIPKQVNPPSKEEVNRHMVSHIPFRSWCEHCVKGKSGGNRHEKRGVIWMTGSQ